MQEKERRKGITLITSRSAIFFCLTMLIPLLIQWGIFYVYANINSALLSFQRYDVATDSFKFYPQEKIFENFIRFFSDIFSGEDVTSYFLMGCLYHLIGVCIGLPLSLMCSFAIYKKVPASGVFKVLLYLPVILSSMVIALIFKYFMDKGLTGIMQKLFTKTVTGMFTEPKNSVPVLLFYSAFFSIPGSLLINLGTMSRTPNELIEYGNMEGMGMWQEFSYITLPMMFPVLQIYCLGMFAGFFTASGPLYAIYANNAAGNTKITFAYYMLVSVIGEAGKTKSMYGYTAAASLSIGLISIPVVYATKKIFDRFDPEAEF